MEFNWKNRFSNENSERLFEIFAEKSRINIEPQIFAGNLLFERNYDVEKLLQAKAELLKSIETTFLLKFGSDTKKIIRENILREILLRTILAVGFFSIYFFFIKQNIAISSFVINYTTVAVVLGALHLIPLFWIKKSNKNALLKVQKEEEKMNLLIQKINSELKF